MWWTAPGNLLELASQPTPNHYWIHQAFGSRGHQAHCTAFLSVEETATLSSIHCLSLFQEEVAVTPKILLSDHISEPFPGLPEGSFNPELDSLIMLLRMLLYTDPRLTKLGSPEVLLGHAGYFELKMQAWVRS